MTTPKVNVQANSLDVLARFVLRARRVEQHSLLADKDRLLKWAQGTMRLTLLNGVPRSMILDLPDEEAIDSLAARCPLSVRVELDTPRA
jgi:hypothetical protein